MDLNEFLQAFVDKSDSEKIQYARETGNFLRKAFEGDEAKAIQFAAILTSIFAAADGKLHDHEAQMFGFCINREVSYDDFFQLSQTVIGSKELMSSFFEFVDSCEYEVRLVFASYGLAVLAADNEITKDELKMFLRFVPELAA